MLSPISPILFQIPIFFLLLIGTLQDLRERKVSNNLIIYIILFSLPLIIFNQRSFLIPFSLSILLLALFYITNSFKYFEGNEFGGADTKVLIPLLLTMDINSIFIFFFLFSVANVVQIFIFRKGIPLFVSITFGYLGVILLSLLPSFILNTYGVP